MENKVIEEGHRAGKTPPRRLPHKTVKQHPSGGQNRQKETERNTVLVINKSNTGKWGTKVGKKRVTLVMHVR